MNERSYETLLYGITANVVAKLMELNGLDFCIHIQRELQMN